MVMQIFKNSLPGSIPFLLIMFLAGLILLQGKRTRNWGRRWLWGLFLGYLGFSVPLISGWVAAPLAYGIVPLQKVEAARGARAVVVLDSGTLRYHNSENLLELPDSSGALRALETARVYRLLGEPLVIVSGGAPLKHGTAEASALRNVLVKLGVSPRHIILDSDSQNTRAHALNVVHLLRARGVSNFVLVTSPTHMRRSIAAFRTAGADPIPSPSASPVDDMLGWEAFWPSPTALLLTEQVMHDFIGLAYYRFMGWL